MKAVLRRIVFGAAQTIHNRPPTAYCLLRTTHYFAGAHQRYTARRVRAYFAEHLRGESTPF